jgi:hypothetical protein
MPAPSYNGDVVEIIAHPPNDKHDVEVRENYRTIVREALDLSEERLQCHQRALYGLSFTVTADGRELQSLRKQFEQAQAKPFGVPIWPHKTMLTAAVAIGGTDLVVDPTEGTLFPVCDYVLIWSDWETWEVCRLSSALVDGELTLTDATTLTWAAGTSLNPVYVLPLFFGEVKRPPAEALNDEVAHVKIEFEEVWALQITADPEDDTPTVVDDPEVNYNPCKDEITVDLPSVSGLENVVIYHGETSTGPWLWWGETRQAESQVILSNYFSGRWIKIVGETTSGNVTLARFAAESPLVAPPLVSLQSHHRNDIYPTGHTDTPLSDYDLPYGGGYSGRTLDAEIAAVYTGNLTDAETSVEQFRLELFSDAFVEVGPRYHQDYGAGGSWNAHEVRVNVTTAQSGAVVRFTVDGSDPTLLNGYDTGEEWNPVDHDSDTPFCPYIIARCFKDGCKSPPVYIPIDLHQDIHTDLQPLTYIGESTSVCGCGVFSRENDCTLNLHFHDTCGDPSGDTPCTADLEGMEDAAIENACASTTDGGFQAYVMQDIDDNGTPLGFYTDFADDYYGPDPGGCPAAFYGGGNWKVGVRVLRLRDYSYSWNSEFTDYTANAFFNLYSTLEINAVEATYPATGTLMPFAEDMTGAGGAATNDLEAKMLTAVSGANASTCPGDGRHVEQVGAGILVSCARAATT